MSTDQDQGVTAIELRLPLETTIGQLDMITGVCLNLVGDSLVGQGFDESNDNLLFTTQAEGDLWDDAKVKAFAEAVQKIAPGAEIVVKTYPEPEVGDRWHYDPKN